LVDYKIAERWDGILPETVWIMGAGETSGPLSIIVNSPTTVAAT